MSWQNHVTVMVLVYWTVRTCQYVSAPRPGTPLIAAVWTNTRAMATVLATPTTTARTTFVPVYQWMPTRQWRRKNADMVANIVKDVKNIGGAVVVIYFVTDMPFHNRPRQSEKKPVVMGMVPV